MFRFAFAYQGGTPIRAALSATEASDTLSAASAIGLAGIALISEQSDTSSGFSGIRVVGGVFGTTKIRSSAKAPINEAISPLGVGSSLMRAASAV